MFSSPVSYCYISAHATCVCVCVCVGCTTLPTARSSTRTTPASITTLAWLIHPSDWLPVHCGPRVPELQVWCSAEAKNLSPFPQWQRAASVGGRRCAWRTGGSGGGGGSLANKLLYVVSYILYSNFHLIFSVHLCAALQIPDFSSDIVINF